MFDRSDETIRDLSLLHEINLPRPMIPLPLEGLFLIAEIEQPDYKCGSSGDQGTTTVIGMKP